MTDQPSLRQRVARAIHRYDNHHALCGNDVLSQHHLGEADAVLAELRAELEAASVVGPAADRAFVLTQAERDMLTHALDLAEEEALSLGDGDVDAAELRRMAAESAVVDRVAAETPEPEARCSSAVFSRPHGPHRWEPQPGMTPVRCPGTCCCDHPADEHSVYGCADGCGCEWMPRRPNAAQQPKEA